MPSSSPGTCAAPLPSTLTSITDRNNQTVMTNTYCGSQVSQQVLADGGTWQFAYGSGETDVTDPLGHVRKVLFDPVSGYPSSDTSAAGTPLAQTTTYLREASGLVDSTTDPMGRKTTYSYDSNGNPLTVTRLAGTANAVSQSFTWTSDSQIASVTDELSRTTRFSYSNDCLTGVTDALNQTSTAQCNEQGQTTLITDPLGHQTALGYVGNDLQTVTDALGHTATFATDGLGRVTAITDPMSRTAQHTYDSNGRLKTSTDPRGKVTTYVYDNEGHVISVALPNGTIAYQYDPVYRVKQRTDALNQSESWTYDALGNVLTYKDRKNQTMTYAARDALGRFTSLAYADGSTVTATTYDAGNRLVLLTDSANGTVTHSYDNLDRLTGEATAQGSLLYTYYADGQRQSMTAASQAVVNYTYDAGDRLQMISQGSDTVGFTYDAANRRQTLTLPNGIVASYGYDSASQLTSISYAKTGVTLGTLTYGYNNGGQRISQTGSLASDQLPLATSTNGTFDLNNRQTAFNGLTQTYDTDGNLTGDGVKTYVWNARNQLTQIKQGSTVLASFGYDPLGHRTSKTLNGVTTALLYDGPNTVQETQGSTVNPILTGLGVDERFARNEGSTRSYFLTDALGSTIALTNASAAITQTYQYDPYGNVTNTGGATNPYQYTGRDNDGTGLYYYRARYYSPTMARFVSEDPLGFGGGQNNFYAYVGNNPLKYRDPTGHYFDWDDGVAIGLGAIVGVGSQGLTDLIEGHLSSWQDYAGSAIGGAAAGEASLYLGPMATGAVFGGATNLAKQGLKIATGKQCHFNASSLALDIAIGATLGRIAGPEIAGVTAGRGSYSSIFKQMVTKQSNGTITDITGGTAMKMAAAKQAEGLAGTGFGPIATAAEDTLLPEEESCGCPQ